MTRPYLQSAPIRNRDELGVLNSIDARLREIALSFGASELQYPVLIDRAVLDRAEYPQAFPHLLMSACCVRHPESTGSNHSLQEQHASTQWCLSPAVCYHTYAQLAGRALDELTAFTARGRCFRHEHETAAGIRQIEFEMRELVFLGSRRRVEASVEKARHRLEAVAREIGVHGEWQVAADPFFLPSAAGKALMQRLLRTKLEYQSLDESRLALASVNRHGSFFGLRFDITTGSEPIYSACVAIGLDRWSRHLSVPKSERGEDACAHTACVER